MPLLSFSKPKTTKEPIDSALAVYCSSLVKEYGSGEDKISALSGVNLEVQYGEMTLLVGPSGCGKTTLISIIAGLLDETSGTIHVLGNDLGHMSHRKKTAFRGTNVGFVFQQYNLLPALNAQENAAIPLLIQGLSKRDALAKSRQCLELVGLGARCKSYPSQLSGGQQQRVAIARSLVIEPKLLVCDEPTAALDAKSGQTVMQLLRKVAVQPGRAVIVVTHDSRVFGFGDRIVEMEDGIVKTVTDNRDHLYQHTAAHT